MKVFFGRGLSFGTSALLLLFVFLSGCHGVRPSFHYAFFGTFLIMGIALVIATVVTRRAKRHGKEE